MESATVPRPGDRHPGFVVEVWKCWALVYDGTMQADHYAEAAVVDGAVALPAGDRWWRVWSCRDHLDGLTGCREYGLRRAYPRAGGSVARRGQRTRTVRVRSTSSMSA